MGAVVLILLLFATYFKNQVQYAGLLGFDHIFSHLRRINECTLGARITTFNNKLVNGTHFT